MNNRFKKMREKMTLHPIMMFIVLIGITIILSGFLSLFGFESTYKTVNPVSMQVQNNFVSVESLFSLSGLKYIFSNTVSNFVNFAPLSMLIIILIGIGIMERSGFLKTAFTLLTKHAKKNVVTFCLILIGISFSIIGDISYVVLIPLSGLLFYYGKRNPLIGIVATFGSLTCGYGISLFLTAVDSSLMNETINAALTIDNDFTMKMTSFIFIMGAAVIGLAILLTYITETFVVNKLGKYEFDDEAEVVVTKKERRGLAVAIIVGLLYCLFFVYTIIEGLPFSGALLDNTQLRYIDKLFSYDSFFSNGFVFIVTILFIIFGLVYGIVAKTIKNNNDVCNCLGHSLDDTGRTIVLVFFASLFISVFKKTNIGIVICSNIANFLGSTTFAGLPFVILLFITAALAVFLLPATVNRWSIFSLVAVQGAMHTSIHPVFAQVIFRFGESVTIGLTPLLAYSVIFLAYIQKYKQTEAPVGLFKSFGLIVPYSIGTAILLFTLIVGWYLIGLPIGFGAFAVL